MFKPAKSKIVLNGKKSSVEEVEKSTNINLTEPEQSLIKGNADKSTQLKTKYKGSVFVGSAKDIIALMSERAASEDADNPTQPTFK